MPLRRHDLGPDRNDADALTKIITSVGRKTAHCLALVSRSAFPTLANGGVLPASKKDLMA
ncbi:MAG TPA: hypothetical protein VJM34_15365 [Novosphingobium sp.]|nr:hypothetical protein [Novosphingobium sp.]